MWLINSCYEMKIRMISPIMKIVLLYMSRPNVSSSTGCNLTRNLDAELKQPENLGVIIDNP